jgi:Flp pilus assembly protein TadG
MKPIRTTLLRILRTARAFRHDRGGVAAIEFAMIFPLMLVTFFGSVEFCSAVAIDRKVTLIARTISDLTSQAPLNATSATMTQAFTYALLIITPYPGTPIKAQVSEIYVDSNGNATINWSQGATMSAANTVTLTASTRNRGDTMTTLVPPALLVKNTYLIFSEISYKYVPTVTWGLMATSGIALSDVSYTRPRQNPCVVYNGQPVLSGTNTCPSS